MSDRGLPGSVSNSKNGAVLNTSDASKDGSDPDVLNADVGVSVENGEHGGCGDSSHKESKGDKHKKRKKRVSS